MGLMVAEGLYLSESFFILKVYLFFKEKDSTFSLDTAPALH